VLEASHS